VVIGIVFEALGNIFLSRYILLTTIEKTIDFTKIQSGPLLVNAEIGVGATLVNNMTISLICFARR
jgi:hypothetical protein